MQNGVFAEVEETEFDVNGLVCAGLRGPDDFTGYLEGAWRAGEQSLVHLVRVLREELQASGTSAIHSYTRPSTGRYSEEAWGDAAH